MTGDGKKTTTDRPAFFRGPRPDVPVVDVHVGRQLRVVQTITASPKAPVDLTGKPRIMLVIGPGGSGKTTFLRYAAEMALQRDPNCSAIFSAVGDRRDLANYFPVAQPDTYDPAQEVRWVESLFAHCMEGKVSAAVDLDGGDNCIASLVQQQDDLCGMIEKSGVSVVAVYLLTPRVTDLTTLATLEQAGFQPKATMVILNDGVGDPTVSFDVRFGPIMQHSAFQAIQRRGAMIIRMPRLFSAAAVEARHIGFLAARDGGGESPLNVWDRGRVGSWLTAMSDAFAPSVDGGWMP